MSRAVRVMLLFLCISSWCIQTAHAYSIIDLGSLGGPSYAFGINDLGQVVGLSRLDSGPEHAFVWDQVNGMQGLGTLGGPSSTSYAINNNGKIVGWSSINTFSYHAFLFDTMAANPTMIDLGNLGSPNSHGFDINNADVLVGYSAQIPSGPRAGFVYDLNSPGMTAINALGQSPYTVPHDINSLGQVVGGYNTDQAFMYDLRDGSLLNLGSLGGGTSVAVSINDNGLVAGFSTLADGSEHGFLYDLQTSTMTDLGALDDGPSRARGMDQSGRVVGMSDTADGNRAFLWDNGLMYNLNDLLGADYSDYVMMDAYEINELGWIAGWGTNPAGELRALVAVPENTPAPVPEPGSLLLLSLGALSGYMMVRRRAQPSPV